LIGASGSRDSQALPLLEREMVTDEFQCGRRSVTSTQEQRQVADRTPQSFVMLWIEQSLIRRMRAAMSLVVGTHFESHSLILRGIVW